MKKIAIIDDDKGLVSTIKEFLEAREFSVVEAYGGKSGVDLVLDEKPDLVVLDINMPDMDGRDVIGKLKRDECAKDIPVIMLTGRGEQFERDQGMEMGAVEYIVKPCSMEYLASQINRIIEKKEKDGMA